MKDLKKFDLYTRISNKAEILKSDCSDLLNEFLKQSNDLFLNWLWIRNKYTWRKKKKFTIITTRQDAWKAVSYQNESSQTLGINALITPK